LKKNKCIKHQDDTRQVHKVIGITKVVLQLIGIEVALHLIGIEVALHLRGREVALHLISREVALHLISIEVALHLISIEVVLHMISIEVALLRTENIINNDEGWFIRSKTWMTSTNQSSPNIQKSKSWLV